MVDKDIMVSLGDSKIKEISEVIGNKTCNKILDYLAEKEGTVTDIHEELKIPLNTVDYNVKKLVKAGLIEKASHWWSVKGKKMNAYRVSNKKIVISPKRSLGKSFLVALGLTGIIAWFINFLNRPLEVAKSGADLAVEAVPIMASEGAQRALYAAPEALEAGFFASLGPGSWFLIGAWFAIILFMAVTIIKDRWRI